jgi:hypothetical protein
MVEESPLQIGDMFKVVVFTDDEMILYSASENAYYRTHYLYHGGTLRENDLFVVKTINPINGAITSERVTDGKLDGATCIVFDPSRVATP